MLRSLKHLDKSPDRVSAGDWPAHLSDLDMPGMYSWWVDERGGVDLTRGLGATVAGGRIYAGLTGATKWPSGKVGSATLRSRIGSNHIGGRIRSSTFRLTLAASLRDTLKLQLDGPKRLSKDSEARLTEWIRSHLSLAVFPFPNADALEDLENKVLSVLDPPLNLAGRPKVLVRAKLTTLRADLSRGVEQARSSERDRPAPKSKPESTTKPRKASLERVTLHSEIETILREHGKPMTTQEIADAANTRGVYTKKDGSAITAFQIHGRTKNYPHLFTRDGGTVDLRQ